MQASSRNHKQPTRQRTRSGATFVLVDGRTWVDVLLAVVGAAVALAGALAVEAWWPWVLLGWGLFVATVALTPPRQSRAERVVETH